MSRRRRVALGFISLAIVTGVTLVISEVLFRILLFSGLAFMKSYRIPDLYAAYESEDNYWKLYYLFDGKFKPPEQPHPQLGWVGDFSRETYLHNDAKNVANRKPVLLFGDSFAACSTIKSERECFQGFLNNDPLFGKHYYLLNYGVGGYGVDQILLLLQASLTLYKDPIVVVSIMTWDLDRSAHSVRIGQKPYFQLENGALVLKGVPVNPDPAVFFSENPPDLMSYLYRMWVNGNGRLWRLRKYLKSLEDESQTKNKMLINEKLLLEIINELRHRHIPHVFVIFYPDWIYDRDVDWRESLLRKVLNNNGVPYLSTREVVFEDAKRLGKNPREYYSEGHPTAYQYKLVSDLLKSYIFQHVDPGEGFTPLSSVSIMLDQLETQGP